MSDNDGYDSPDQLSSGCPSPMNNAGNESGSEQSNHNNSPMKSPASSQASRVSEPSEDSDCSPTQTNFNKGHSDDERSIHGDENNDGNGLDYENDNNSPRAASEDGNIYTGDADNVSANDANVSEEERMKDSDDEEVEDNIASPNADVNDEDLNHTNNAEDDIDNISDSEAENGNEYKKNYSGESDDEPNEGKVTKKNREKIESDDDDFAKKSGSEDEGNVEELFGNASDISSSNEDDDGQANDTRNESACELSDQNQSSSQRWRDGSLNEDDEDDEGGRKHEMEEEEEEIQEIRIDAVFPKINTNLGDSLHFVKLPNFLSIDPKTFDEQQYEDEVDEEELMDEEGRTRLKLKVENTLRWRYAKDANGNLRYDEHGNLVKESNARMVRWSDGSLSLHLGNEVFDVHPMEMKSDHTHLFVRQGLGLQGQAVFTSKLSFRPHSTDSFTHRKMTLSLADRSSKAQKVKVLPIVGKNPESQRSELIKKEDDKLKAVMRRENKQRRIKEKAFKRGISSHYMETGYEEEEEEDENTVSVSATKKRHKGHKPIYTSDDDSDDNSRRRSTKRPVQSDSEEEEMRKIKKKNVVSDSDED